MGRSNHGALFCIYIRYHDSFAPLKCRSQDLAAVDTRWSELLVTLLNLGAIAGF